MNTTSDFLFAQNSFLVGAGSAFDLWGSYFSYNTSRTANEADGRAIFSDWAMAGKDIQNAGAKIRREKRH
jgi:hypothetical protein